MKTRKVLGFALSLLMLVQVFAGLGMLPASAGSNLTATVVPITASNVLIAGNGATNLMTSTAQLGVSGGSLQESVSKYFDGTVPGVTTTDPNWGDWNGLGANTDYYLWYDFGSATELNVIELGGINGHSGFPTFTLPAFSLYATNDLDALKAGTLTPVASVTTEEAAAAKGFVAVLSETVSVRYVAVKIRSYSHVGKSSECWISEFGAANLTAAMKNAFAFGGSLTGDSQQTVYVPVTDKAQLPETNLLTGQIPTRPNGTRPNTAFGTALANLTDGGVHGLDQIVSYRLTENAMSNGGTGSYYNWIAPTEMVSMLGYDTSKTWYIQDNNTRWWASSVNDTAGTLYRNDAQLVYDLGAIARVESLFIASATEIGDGLTNGNTTGPNAPCSWDVVQAQMGVTHPDRYALVCHVYVGNTMDVFTSGTEVMSFDWREAADKSNALRNLFQFSEAVEARYVGFDFTDDYAVGEVIRLSELAVYGVSTAKATGYAVTSANADKALAKGDNVFSNAAGIYKAVDVADATVFSADLSGKFNDGVMGGINAIHGTDGDICDAPGSGITSVAENEWMFLTVDMGKRYAFDSFLFAGSGVGNYGVYGFQLFVNDTPLASMVGAADREALYTCNDVVQDGYRVDFIKPVTGRYVHMLCKMRSNAGSYQMWVSELMATGVCVETATGYAVNTNNADKAIAAEDNVLAKATGITWAADSAGATASSPKHGNCFDGVMCGINAEFSASVCDDPIGTAEYMMLTVDMGAPYSFDSFMLVGSGTGNYGVEGFSLFINDTPLTSMVGAANRTALYTCDSNVTNGYRVDLLESVTGQYVHVLCRLKKNAGNWQMWVSELMATGVCVEKATGYAVNTNNADQAIALADNVLTKATGITWAADSAGAGVSPVSLGYCFDGVMGGVNADFVPSICNDPIGSAEYMMLTLDMGLQYAFDSFMLAGSGTGSYGVEGFTLFINDMPLSSMVGSAARKALYACDSVVANGYRVDFSEPVTGQYVHVLCHLKDNVGNWQMWLTELAATGKAVQEDTRTERKVVTVGDSITEGVHFPSLDNWSTAVFENRYSDVLVNMLNKTDETYRYTLYNAGISGAATVGAERVGNVDNGLDWLNHSRKPEKIQYCDVLTIMLGTNDAPNWSARKNLYKECYTNIVNAYRALNPDLQLYVLTSPYTTNTGYAALEREIVPLQKELAQELGGTLIDVYKNTKIYTLSHETTDFLDAIDVAKGLSVHPGENGHKVIAEIVYAGMTNTAIPSYITDHTCQYTETVTKEATCGEEGVKTLTCSLCGDTRTESIPATGKHTYDEGVVTKEATCTEPGEKTFTCDLCGDTTTEPIQALDHDWSAEWTVDVEATIVSEGSQSHHCNRCDEKRDVTPIPKKTPASTGWYTDETTGLTYYVHDDSSVNENTRIQIGSQYYNFYPADSVVDGKNVSYSLLQGWVKMPNGTTRYYAEGEYWYKTGFKKVDGKYYFFDGSTGALYLPDAATVTNGVGWYRSGTVCYALDAQTGAWIYGLYTDGNGDTYYYNKYSATSSYATGFVTVDGEELYFGADGKLVTDENVIPKNGWFTDEISGKTYYFKDGVKNTASRLSIDGQWVNFDEDGARLLGWVTMPNGITRYYGEGEYWYKTGFKKVDGKFYFFNATSGALYIPSNTEYGVGWYRSGNVYYALDPETGAWIHGLYTDRNGDTYYFPKYATTQGYYVGTVTVGGVEYTFGEDGKLVQ